MCQNLKDKLEFLPAPLPLYLQHTADYWTYSTEQPLWYWKNQHWFCNSNEILMMDNFLPLNIFLLCALGNNWGATTTNWCYWKSKRTTIFFPSHLLTQGRKQHKNKQHHKHTIVCEMLHSFFILHTKWKSHTRIIIFFVIL